MNSKSLYGGEPNPFVIANIPSGIRTVLDVGCGTGGNAAALREQGAIVDGVTASSDESQIARQICRSVIIYDLENGLPANLEHNYDLCLCSHVIEHIARPERLLSDIRTLLLPQRGTLIVCLPNVMFWRNRLRLIAGDFIYTDSGLMDQTHLKWYTWDTARELLEGHGFDVVTRLADGGLPLRQIRRMIPPGILARIDRKLVTWWPGLFGHQHLLIARPK